MLKYIPTERMKKGNSGLKIIEKYDGSTILELDYERITLEDVKEFCELNKMNDDFDLLRNNIDKTTVFMDICKYYPHDPEKCNDILQYLSSGKNSNINKVEYTHGNSTLMWCCANGEVDICLKLMKEFNADPFVKDSNGRVRCYNKISKNALHLLIAKGHTRQIPVIKLILNGADVKDHINDQASDGSTALHLACARRDWRYIELLLKAEASLEIEDNNGRIPLDILNLNDIERLQIIDSYLNGQVEICTYDSYVNDDWIKNIATFDRKVFYTNQNELENNINKYYEENSICGTKKKK